jgi:predicted O-linked N-acetylglucosamine transferase (SPINDLY family)
VARRGGATVSAAALDRAREQYRAGDHGGAAATLRAALAADGTEAELWALLAWCLDALGDGAGSREAVATALARDPAQRSALALGAMQAEREQRFDRALGYTERLAAASPGDVHALFNLGAARSRVPGRERDAEAAWRSALGVEPLFWPALVALGQSAFARGDYGEAATDFQAAATLAPRSLEPWLWLGLAELRRHRGDDALATFARARAIAPDDADVWRGLAEASELAGRREDAIAARRRELTLRPERAESHWEAAAAFSRCGLDDEARAELATAVALAPERLLPRWLSMQLLPRLYRDAEEAREWHARWLARLAEFERIDLDDARVRAQLPECLAAATNFSLHYLGGALREEQSRYGALLTGWARRCHPQVETTRAPRPDGRLRVGFASAHLRPHTISKLFRRWISDLDRARFEVVAIDLGAVREGGAPEGVGLGADRVLGPHDRVERWHEALLGAELDVLVWLDVGMDGTTQALAPLRYAPVQCVAWGHPVTTGLPSIDCFLSGAAMEPERPEPQYTERLVALPGLGIAYDIPERARDIVRAARNPGAAPVLLCAQSVYKLTPVHYGLFARIAAAVPDARFEFCPHPSPGLDLGARVADPFRTAFRALGQDFDARAIVHPFLDQDRFFATLARADVLLDTVDWSGGNTTLEALATGLPVVTLPRETMRSRHSHGMLRVLGLDSDLSALDEDGYVGIATRLVRDAGFHAGIVAAIRERQGRLFGDVAPIRALEAFLLRACGRAE